MNEEAIKVFESFAANCRLMATRAQEAGWVTTANKLNSAARSLEFQVTRWGRWEEDGVERQA
jgi:hypothetical protein